MARFRNPTLKQRTIAILAPSSPWRRVWRGECQKTKPDKRSLANTITGRKISRRRQHDGRLSLLPILANRQVGPSRFPHSWQQVANRSRLASRSVARLAERPPPQKSVRDFKVGFSFSNRVFAGAPSTSLAALGYLDFRKACFPGP